MWQIFCNVVVSQTTESIQITFKWTQPSALNGLPVTSYKLLFYQPNASPAGYYEVTFLCNAEINPAFSATQCSVEMTQIVSVLGYTAYQIVSNIITVGAIRAKLASSPSDNTIKTQIIPQASPGSFAATSTASTITLT